MKVKVTDNFRMCVTGVYSNDATKWQIAEAVKDERERLLDFSNVNNVINSCTIYECRDEDQHEEEE